MNMHPPAPLRASALYYAYGPVPVLLGVDIEIPAGRVTAIAGPNGAGKSTLLELLAGVQKPGAGSIERPASVALVVQRPDAPAQLPLTAGDVVGLGVARAHGSRWGARGLRAARTAAALDRVGALELAGLPFASLSGGQRQRVCIAQGIAVGAPVLLLDEPAAGLDAESRERTRQILAAEAARGVAVASVTHDAEDLAAADRTVWLERGTARLETAG
ncbi:hypothetical protein AUL38_06030 [Leucobacter sp. G161]|nr:hypothetical protein AUL38_06030 [Leucobacter sp. G161]